MRQELAATKTGGMPAAPRRGRREDTAPGRALRPQVGMHRDPPVTGKTIVIPLIGHPVAQVRTPGPMNVWLAERGIDAVVVPMDIRPERVRSFFDLLKAMENCIGCSITMPHKQAGFVASDEVTERARRAKAVNTIRRTPTGRLVGDMTDGIAMVAALEENAIRVRGRDVLLIGAGGAGTAIAFELADKGAASLTVLERDRMRRRALLAELTRLHPRLDVQDSCPAGRRFDIAINASPTGMDPRDPLPYPVDRLDGALIVADAVTKPPVTPWLEEAGRRGLKIQTGEQMALAQLPIQMRFLRMEPSPDAGEAARNRARSAAGQEVEG